MTPIPIRSNWTLANIPLTMSRQNRPVELFGGNSNWRGPVWFPLNMLIIESLQKFHYYFGDEYKVECPYWFWKNDDPLGGR